VEKKHVTVAGNIGAGKSSLTRVLSDYFGWKAFYERVEDNPYLEDFYDDMRRWSFNLQVFFLSNRFRQRHLIDETPRSVVQDRSIYEDAEIFARNLHDMDLMSDRDYANYRELYESMLDRLRAPDLLIYLRASVSTLVDHIEGRGRDYENSIQIDYLRRLKRRYETWIDGYALGPKMIIEVDAYDFVNNDDDYRAVIDQVESRLFGLFPE
jgi:deoxyadenosine/deoxycytidine kinase